MGTFCCTSSKPSATSTCLTTSPTMSWFLTRSASCCSPDTRLSSFSSERMSLERRVSEREEASSRSLLLAASI